MHYNGLAKPQKQITQLPSKFLMKHLYLFKSVTDPIVDVACGYGRNAKVLAETGCIVHCLDRNADALAFLSGEEGHLIPQCIDLTQSDWPFPPDSLGAVVNVHYYQESLIDCFLSSLKLGGLLLIETIDGRKGNHLQLPKADRLHTQLKEYGDFIDYSETRVTSVKSDVSSVKLLMRKLNEKSVS